MQRILPVARVSLDRDDSDSIERQVESMRQWAGQRPHVSLLPAVEDRSISGSVSPMQRPALGPWFGPDHIDQWDGIIVTTQDRISRSDLHTYGFIATLLEHDKVLYIVDDPSLDMSSLEGRLQIQVRAYAAAKELERIKSRIKDSHNARHMTRAWQTGIPPYGYITVWGDVGGIRRRVLEVDDHSSSVVRLIFDQFNGGRMRSEIVEELMVKGEPSPYDYHRGLYSLDKKRSKWSTFVITSILTQPSTLGIKMTKRGGKRAPITLPNGDMLRIAEPLVEQAVWDEAQAVLAAQVKGRRARTSNPLSGIVVCGECGSNASISSTTHSKKTYTVYRCNRTGTRRCNVRVNAFAVENTLENDFLIRHGNAEIQRRVWREGSDATRELAMVRESIRRLQNEKDSSSDWDDMDEDDYKERMSALRERRKRLSAIPTVESRWEYEGTGETHREMWERTDKSGRLRALRGMGCEVVIFADKSIAVRYPTAPMGDNGDQAFGH